jgi:flagellar hook-basal body complex protein FliE
MSELGIANIALGQLRALRQPDAPLETEQSEGGFADKIKDLLDGVNAQVKHADAKVEAYISGADIPIHNVMIELSKAEMSMRLTSAVTSKVLEAYQEITRMQL